MRPIAAVFLLGVVVAAQSYPPPFPRAGASKLLDNERVVVWDYPGTAAPTRHQHTGDTVAVWLEGRAGRAIFLPAGTIHTTEPISAGAKATIFELN